MNQNSDPYPPTPFKFSNEELRVLQECNSESFFYRCLPLSAILGLGTHLGVKNGYFAPTRYGSAPKVALAVVVGYLVGKVSYQGKCAEKIMALPDSKLGQMLRERRRAGKYSESLTMDQPELTKLFGDSPPTDVYSDSRSNESAPSYMDVDTDRPTPDIDGAYWSRPDDSRMRDDALMPPPPPSRTITSYDELRKRNRDEYETGRNRYRQSLRDEAATQPPTEAAPLPPLRDDNWSPTSSNIYSDSWSK